MVTQYKKLDELKPHPRNEEIYGHKEDVSDLAKLMQDKGFIQKYAVTINPDNVIICGHRRWLAAQQVGLSEIPVIVEHYATTEDELEALILDNYYRTKTPEQKVREGMVLEEVIAKRKKQKSLANLKQFSEVAESATSEKEGNTRDIIAKKVGLSSGRTFSGAKSVVEKIDQLKESGNIEDAELLSGVLNKAPSTAERFIKRVDILNLDEDVKQGIMCGEISASSVITATENRTIKDIPATITKQDIANAINEFNAINRGEKEPERIVYEGNILINSIIEMTTEFRTKMAQVMSCNIEIQNLTKDELTKISGILNEFETAYKKNKTNLLKEISK